MLKYFLLLIVLLIPFAYLTPMRYEANDDIGAQMILSGSDGFEAQPAVPFFSAYWNHVLHNLIRLLPNIPVYAIAVYATLTYAYAMIVRVILSLPVDRLKQLLALFSVFLVAIWAYLSLSFTSAALMALVGVNATLLARARGITIPIPNWQLFIAIVLAFGWRWKLSLFFLGFTLPMLLVFDRRQLRQAVPVVIAVLAVVLIDRGLASATQSEQQSNYESFSVWRSRFQDSPTGFIGGQRREAMRSAGWSQTEFGLIYFLSVFFDEEKANAANFEKFLQAADSTGQITTYDRAMHGIRSIWANAGGYSILAFFSAFGMAFVMSVNKVDTKVTQSVPGWRWFAFITITAAATLVLAFYRFVPRVAIPVLVYWCLILCIYFATRPPSAFVKKRATGLLGAGMVCFFLLVIQSAQTLAAQVASNRALNIRSAQIESVVQKWRKSSDQSKSNPDVIVRMNLSTGLAHEGGHPLKQTFLEGVRLVPSGWQSQSPRYYSALKELGYESGTDLMRGAAQGELNLLLYATRRTVYSRALTLWTDALNTFGDKPVELKDEFTEMDEYSNFTIYRAVPKTSPKREPQGN